MLTHYQSKKYQKNEKLEKYIDETFDKGLRYKNIGPECVLEYSVMDFADKYLKLAPRKESLTDDQINSIIEKCKKEKNITTDFSENFLEVLNYLKRTQGEGSELYKRCVACYPRLMEKANTIELKVKAHLHKDSFLLAEHPALQKLNFKAKKSGNPSIYYSGQPFLLNLHIHSRSIEAEPIRDEQFQIFTYDSYPFDNLTYDKSTLSNEEVDKLVQIIKGKKLNYVNFIKTKFNDYSIKKLTEVFKNCEINNIDLTNCTFDGKEYNLNDFWKACPAKKLVFSESNQLIVGVENNNQIKELNLLETTENIDGIIRSIDLIKTLETLDIKINKKEEVRIFQYFQKNESIRNLTINFPHLEAPQIRNAQIWKFLTKKKNTLDVLDFNELRVTDLTYFDPFDEMIREVKAKNIKMGRCEYRIVPLFESIKMNSIIEKSTISINERNNEGDIDKWKKALQTLETISRPFELTIEWYKDTNDKKFENFIQEWQSKNQGHNLTIKFKNYKI